MALFGPCGIGRHHLKPGEQLIKVNATLGGIILGEVVEVPDDTSNGVPVVTFDIGGGDLRWARLTQVVDLLHADEDDCRPTCVRLCSAARDQWAATGTPQTPPPGPDAAVIL